MSNSISGVGPNKSTFGLQESVSNFHFSGFTLKPEKNWTSRNKESAVEAVFPHHKDNPKMLKLLESSGLSPAAISEFKETGKLTLYVTSPDAKEIKDLQAKGWNMTFSLDGMMGSGVKAGE